MPSPPAPAPPDGSPQHPARPRPALAVSARKTPAASAASSHRRRRHNRRASTPRPTETPHPHPRTASAWSDNLLERTAPYPTPPDEASDCQSATWRMPMFLKSGGSLGATNRARPAVRGTMGQSKSYILERAIERKQPVTLSVSVDGTDFQFRARLVRRSHSTETLGVWAELIQGERRPLQTAIDMRAPVEATFMESSARVCFGTCILAREKNFAVADKIVID